VKRGAFVAIGVCAYAFALIATAPATLVDAALQRATEGRLRVAEARGTLWSGAGQIEIRAAGGSAGVARSITWRVVPASLLRGQLVCEVGLEQTQRHFPLTISPSRVELANADIHLPAAVLGLAVPKLAPLGLTGDAAIHITSLSMAPDAIAGSAALQWRAAGSALSPVSPLGDYELRVDGEGRTARAILRTVEGPLQLDGKGSWTHGARPVFLATARVLPRHQEQLAPLLRLIAVERGEGNFELQLN